ncbi:MAG: hypothetical protein OCC45_15170 [Desulfotalea sp.]
MKLSSKSLFLLCFILCAFLVSCKQESEPVRVPSTSTPVKLPIGVNLRETNYYSPNVPFNDIMKTASKMITYDISRKDSSWDTGVLEQIPRDASGWPLQLPVVIDGTPHGIRILVNNTVSGEHVLLHEGTGEYAWRNLDGVKKDGRTYLNLNGEGGHIYLQISRSDADNHLRNMRLILEEYREKEEEMPLFRSLYLQGLRPFHCLRFMEWTKTNNSEQIHWQDRSRPEYYSQGLNNGISLEYAIELANKLNVDAWFCVPHMASDNYIKKMAQLIRDTLQKDLTCYIEYSNEIWNWQFEQAHWVLNNGLAPRWPKGFKEETRSVEKYVEKGLARINKNPEDHPKKDAFMMARTFRIFSEVFEGQMERVVRVAGVQHAWIDNTERILEYLFETDGVGCDAVSPAGYVGFGEKDHLKWLQMDPETVTSEMVIQAARTHSKQNEWGWTEKTAQFAKKYNIDFLVYEGGQHIQPWQQQDWKYNQAVWDAQITPSMYDLYKENFIIHTSPQVNCKLFMAYCYLGPRESRYGSWGHLESLKQLEAGNILQNAPKYQGLLDANSPKDNVQ